MMIYSNDQPTPTKFRPRTYAITLDHALTDEDFQSKYEDRIRRVNAQFDCNFIITYLCKGDLRVQEYLRSLGVSPAKITIYHLAGGHIENKYNSPTREFDKWSNLENELITYSSHDIGYIPPYVPDGFVQRIFAKRKIKEKTNPFREVIK
jgi:hypothetical protein